MMLYKLLLQSDRIKYRHHVISLIDKGTLGDAIEKLGVTVYSVGMARGRLPGPNILYRLIMHVRQINTDIFQGWMYHGNLGALLASVSAVNKPGLVWNIRHSLNELQKEKKQTSKIIRIGEWFSEKPLKVIYNSTESMQQHIDSGYSDTNSIVIPNGFDCDQFKPSEDAYFELRKSLGLKNDSIIIGLVGRYHAVKGHDKFLRAAKLLKKSYPGIHFVLAGFGVDNDNHHLRSLIEEFKLNGHVHLLGERHDIHRITAGFDISTSSSLGEAFPNVIGEAMACGVPCVVTNVGDSSMLVKDTGIVVPPKDPVALCDGWKTFVEMDDSKRRGMGLFARQRIIDFFSLQKITMQYENLYSQVLNTQY